MFADVNENVSPACRVLHFRQNVIENLSLSVSKQQTPPPIPHKQQKRRLITFIGRYYWAKMYPTTNASIFVVSFDCIAVRHLIFMFLIE